LVGLYVERDGAWHLDVEGAVDPASVEELRRAGKAKLEEFRATNVALMKERDELKQRFEGIDPEEVRKLADEKRKLEEAQQIKAGEVEKVVEARVRTVKGDLDKRLAGVSAERDSLTSRLTAIQIDQAAVTEATKRGLRASAIPDITSRARNTFRLVNGVPQALEADGQTARVGKDGMTPLSVAEWIDMQVSEAPHLFESNAGDGGGGATSPYGNGSGGAGNRSARNPFRQELYLGFRTLPRWQSTRHLCFTYLKAALRGGLKCFQGKVWSILDKFFAKLQQCPFAGKLSDADKGRKRRNIKGLRPKTRPAGCGRLRESCRRNCRSRK